MPVIVAGLLLVPATARAATAPKNTAVPAVTGIAAVGQTLSTDTGTWTGSPAPTFTFQWQRCKVGGSCSGISGATSTTYDVVKGDKGFQLRSRVTGKNSGGKSAAFSAKTPAVTETATPANTAPPTITGTAVDGATLTAKPGSWTGTPAPAYSYQWLQCIGGNCAPIGGARDTNYTLQHADVGSTIEAEITAKNSAGSAVATSAPTGVVAAQAPSVSVTPSFLGTPTSGTPLNVDHGSWNGTPPFDYGYQWRQCDSAGANCADIAGATDLTYTPLPAHIGHRLVVTVTATNTAVTAGVSSTSPSAVVVAGQHPPINTAAPVVSGVHDPPVDGDNLTATPGQWDNLPTSVVGNWQRCNASGVACTAIGGASGATYTLTSDDVNATVRLLEVATNADGSINAPSDTTAVVGAAAPVHTALPSITGTPVDGATLTVDPGTWSGTTPIHYGFQWQRSTDGDHWSDIDGATQLTYDVGPDDVDKYLHVIVVGSNATVTTDSATSPATNQVAAAQPGVLANPSVTGSAQVNSTLVATSGSWTGTGLSAPDYQWLRCPKTTVPPNVSACTSVAGNVAAANQRTLTNADRDFVMVMAVTRSNTVGGTPRSATAYSVPTAAVVPLGPVNKNPPTISGTPKVGQTMTASNGAWQPADHSFSYANGDLTYSYLWQQCDSAHNCTPEPVGGTGQSYLVRVTDAGFTLSVAVTVTDQYGQQSSSQLSAATVMVSGSGSSSTVADWAMDDGNDGVMHDASAYGNDGTLQNIDTGSGAYGFTTSGPASRVVVPNSASLNPGSNTFTVTLHVRFDQRPKAGTDYDVIRKGQGDAANDWKIEIMETGKARCYTNGSKGKGDVLSGSAVSTGAWHTIVCTFTPSSVKVSVDGTSKTVKSTIGSISNNAALSIGAKYGAPDDGGDQYVGKMDDVVITSQ